MQPTLTQTEYWLLDANITHRLPLCLVAVPGDVFGHMNRHWHGMERDHLIATLIKLFNQGLISATPYGSSDPGVALTEADIVRAIERRDYQLSYGVTSAGGVLWEAYSAPDWSRFVWQITDDQEGYSEYWSASRASIERRLEPDHMYDRTILTETMAWDTVEPWQATYWKSLPHAYHLHCSIQPQAGPSQFFGSASDWDGWTWYQQWWQGLPWDPAWAKM
jgi:hypothetical protein